MPCGAIAVTGAALVIGFGAEIAPELTNAVRTAPAEAGCVCVTTFSTVVATALRSSRDALLTTCAARAGSSGGGTFLNARIISSTSCGAANTGAAANSAANDANAVIDFVFMSFSGKARQSLKLQAASQFSVPGRKKRGRLSQPRNTRPVFQHKVPKKQKSGWLRKIGRAHV